MDISKLKNGGEQRWIKIPGSEKGMVLIDKIRPKQMRDIRRTCVKKKFKGGRQYDDTDHDRLNMLLLTSAVKDWKGIADGDKEFPFNDANLKWLDDNCGEFNKLWNSVVNEDALTEQQIEEAELGN